MGACCGGTDEFLLPLDLVAEDGLLGETFDLLLYGVVLVCPGVFARGAGLGVIVAEAEHLGPVCAAGDARGAGNSQ